MLLVFLLFLVLFIYSIAWAAADANSRGKSGFLVGLLVFLVHPWPLGLILWLVFRPERYR
jgi:hypothetical protein